MFSLPTPMYSAFSFKACLTRKATCCAFWCMVCRELFACFIVLASICGWCTGLLSCQQLSFHIHPLCAFLTGVILKGLTLWKFVSDVCVRMFYVCKMIGFVDWLHRGLICTWEEFRNVYLLMSLTVLRWPCVVDRTLNSNYYYYYYSTSTNIFSLCAVFFIL